MVVFIGHDAILATLVAVLFLGDILDLFLDELVRGSPKSSFQLFKFLPADARGLKRLVKPGIKLLLKITKPSASFY